MHADGYAGFEYLYRSGDNREVACLAHVRRIFVDVYKAQGSAIADEAIRRIAGLHVVEKALRGLSPDKRAEIRQAEAKPVFDGLEIWLNPQLPGFWESPRLPQRSAMLSPERRGCDPFWTTAFWRLTTTPPNARCGWSLWAEGLPVCRFANRRQIRRHRLHPDRNRKAQWRRSSGVARRHTRPHPGPHDQPY